jgi:hypothetical protein
VNTTGEETVKKRKICTSAGCCTPVPSHPPCSLVTILTHAAIYICSFTTYENMQYLEMEEKSCVQLNLWYGDSGSHHTSEIVSSNFLMIT